MMNLRKNLTKSSIALILSIVLLGLAITSSQNGDNVSGTSSLRKPLSHKFENFQGLYTLIEEEEDADECYHSSDFSQTFFVSHYIDHLFGYYTIYNANYSKPLIYVYNKYKRNIIPLRS